MSKDKKNTVFSLNENQLGSNSFKSSGNKGSEMSNMPLNLIFPNPKKSKYLPLERVEMSEKYFNIILREQINVRTKEFDDFRDMFNALYIGDIKTAEKIRNHYSEKKHWQKLYNYFQSNMLGFGADGNTDDNVQNITMSLITMLEWSKNKQVFKFDTDFLMELTETESVMFKKDMLDYLPYKTFYLDFKDANADNSRVEGIFVNIFKKTDSYEIRLNFMNRKGQLVYNFDVKNDNYEIKNKNLELNNIRKMLIDDLGIIDTAVNSLRKALDEETRDKETGLKISYDYWENVILQILTYLCSEKPDIQESEETKYTYRKPNENFKPKNKFSEIQKWEVGVRFGTSMRKWKMQKENESQDYDSSESSSENGKHHKPHYRRGHWHSYWCNQIIDGKKTKRLVPKWLAPIFVNKDLCDDVDVVIHKS